ncbi:MAG: hypothetical protein H7062_14830 [Candidatus Saccharimonas sp.]|nr:hypothetical protein [Planctomycetaceae bacterium]
MAIDFKDQLSKQLRFLQTSCREYDAGNPSEAIRIAQALRVIFHNTHKSKSLLMHLQASSIQMHSTCRRTRTDNPNGYWPGLVQIHIDVEQITISCTPVLDETPHGHRMVPVDTWWSGEVVFFGETHTIRRNKLVLDAANKDGGAHVDVSLPPDYQWMLNGSGFAFSRTNSSGTQHARWVVFPHLACLRQMAHEVFKSPPLLALAE